MSQFGRKRDAISPFAPRHMKTQAFFNVHTVVLSLIHKCNHSHGLCSTLAHLKSAL